MPRFHSQHVPPLRQDASVEEDRGHVGDQQGGAQSHQHGDALNRSLLDIDTVLQGASWEMQDWLQPQRGLATEQPYQQADQHAQQSPIAVGDLSVQHAYELREDQDVGHLNADEPKEQNTVLQCGESCPDHTHHHDGAADHPLDLPVRRLWTEQNGGTK